MTTQTSTNSSEFYQPQTVGTMLRHARSKMGYTLAEVATVTRIPRNMLENLEEDRFAEYSASVFARGHLMSYARELRLDPHQIMRQYERQTGKIISTSTPTPSTTRVEAENPVAVNINKTKQAIATRRRQMTQTPNVRWNKAQFGKLAEWMRPRHMAGLVLILCAFFAAVSFVNGNRATAQNTAEFPKASKNDWKMERDVEKTRWLLEQPAAATKDQ